MSSCTACAEARRNRYSGEYRRGCLGCDLRGLARSAVAKEATDMRSDAPFREALALSHPNIDADVAMAAIRDWWRLDHPTSEGTA